MNHPPTTGRQAAAAFEYSAEIFGPGETATLSDDGDRQVAAGEHVFGPGQALLLQMVDEAPAGVAPEQA